MYKLTTECHHNYGGVVRYHTISIDFNGATVRLKPRAYLEVVGDESNGGLWGSEENLTDVSLRWTPATIQVSVGSYLDLTLPRDISFSPMELIEAFQD